MSQSLRSSTGNCPCCQAPWEGDARIAHRVPGRIRLAFNQIADAPGMSRVLQDIPGVQSVEINSLTGSVLVRYEERHVDGMSLFLEACRFNYGFPDEVEPWMKLGSEHSAAGLERTNSKRIQRDIDEIRVPVRPAPNQIAPDAHSRDVVRLGLELLLGIITADVRPVIACILAAAIVTRKDRRPWPGHEYSN
jgi:hypothetical protein